LRRETQRLCTERAGRDEAIFSPDGRAHHAEGAAQRPDALASLRRAVVEVERVRGPERGRPIDYCLGAWQGLVQARWSLVDRFESDGKRYVVARENEPQPRGLGGLSMRERQVVAYAALGHDNKVIAYDLGIAHSTVRVLLSRAASKLGVSSRQDLIHAYRSSQSTAPSSESRP
jgi:DNA-binding CsgD family transcriptional regulator